MQSHDTPGGSTTSDLEPSAEELGMLEGEEDMQILSEVEDDGFEMAANAPQDQSKQDVKEKTQVMLFCPPSDKPIH